MPSFVNDDYSDEDCWTGSGPRPHSKPFRVSGYNTGEKSMGDIADMHADALWDDPDELFDVGYYRSRKALRCRSCGKGDLLWRKVSGNWIMMEQDGRVHRCEGYEPPIESLKVIANEIIKETKEEALWKLKDKAKQRGGLTKLINIISDEQLLELYTSFVRDDQHNYDEPDIGMSFGYGREISFLKKEILRRMN